jgi:hypothetical protein
MPTHRPRHQVDVPLDVDVDTMTVLIRSFSRRRPARRGRRPRPVHHLPSTTATTDPLAVTLDHLAQDDPRARRVGYTYCNSVARDADARHHAAQPHRMQDW